MVQIALYIHLIFSNKLMCKLQINRIKCKKNIHIFSKNTPENREIINKHDKYSQIISHVKSNVKVPPGGSMGRGIQIVHFSTLQKTYQQN